MGARLPRRDRGVALLNALVLAAALATVATYLVAEAGGSRARLAMLRDTAQAGLYLDAVEGLVPRLLEADWDDGTARDDLTETWAAENYVMPIDRGVASGTILDLQGRFNVNWLTDPEDAEAASAFARLLRGLGLPDALAFAVRQYLAPRGPADPGPYLARKLPLRPAGGPVQLVAELRQVEGMTEADFARLAPQLAALPAASRLNASTATLPVLAAFLPRAGAAALARLDADRRDAGFASVADFRARAEAQVNARLFDEVALSRFGVTTEWFAARLAADLDGTLATRTVILHRPAVTGRVTLAFRLQDTP